MAESGVTTQNQGVAPVLLAQVPGNAAGNGLNRIGTVNVLNGRAMVKHADGSRAELHKGDAVYQGDTIDTDKGAAVGMTFEDGSTFSLGSAGSMVLDELVYDPATKDGHANVALLKGAFTFVSGQIPKAHPDAMKVKTPVMTVGIRGTAGAVNTQTAVLLPEAGGVAGEMQIMTPSGQIMTLNVPGQAATFAGGSLVMSTFSPQQMMSFAGNSLSALPNPGALGGGLNNGQGQGQGQEPHFQAPPPPVPQGNQQSQLQDAMQAQAQALQQAVHARETISQLVAQINAQIVTARNNAIQTATQQLDQAEAARQAAIAESIAAVRAVEALIRPHTLTAQEALAHATEAFNNNLPDDVAHWLSVALAEKNAISVDDADSVTPGVQTLLAQALNATHDPHNASVTYAQAVAVYASEVSPLAQAANEAYGRILELQAGPLRAQSWLDGSAIAHKLDTRDAATAAQDTLTQLQSAANDAADAETAARAAARAPTIDAAAARANWDVLKEGLGEIRVSLGKAVADYIAQHGTSSHAADWYGLTTAVLNAYNDYKAAVDGHLSTMSAVDANLQTDAATKLDALIAVMRSDSSNDSITVVGGPADLDLADNIYSQAISAWITAHGSAVDTEATAHSAYTAAHNLETAANALVTAAANTASVAAEAYAAWLTGAADAATAAALAQYGEMVAATALQNQADAVMNTALSDLSSDLGVDTASTIGSAKGDVAAAKTAAEAAHNAALSQSSFSLTAAQTALNQARSAVNDFMIRDSEATSAVARAKAALDLTKDEPDNIAQAEAASHSIATQAQQKAAADYAKALTIQADISNQKALAQAYLAQAEQAYATAQTYQAAQDALNAHTVAEAQAAADAAALRAKDAWNTVQTAKANATVSANLLNGSLDAGEGRDVFQDLDNRVHTTSGTAVSALSGMSTSLTGATSSLTSFQAAASALGNSVINAKLAAAQAALTAASETSGAVKTASDAVSSARGTLLTVGSDVAAKLGSIDTALHNAEGDSDTATAAAETANNVVDPSLVSTATAAARAAAEAAKLSADEATTATTLAKQLAAEVQALASLQTTVDTKIADAAATVKAAVEAVTWAKADYDAVAQAAAARTAVNSSSNSSDATDDKAAIDSIYNTLTASGGKYAQLTAMKNAALSSTADLQARATIENAFTRAEAALGVINTAKSKVTDLLTGAQTQMSVAETKAALALAATTLGDAVKLSTEAQTAATEAQRLAGLIDDYRAQVGNATDSTNTAAHVIQVAYDEATAATARLNISATLKGFADAAAGQLATAQTAQTQVVKYTDLTKVNSDVTVNALSNGQSADDVRSYAGTAHTDALTVAGFKTTVVNAASQANASAAQATQYYNSLTADQKTSVVTAYYEQAIKAAAEATALQNDAVDRANIAAKADTAAANAITALEQYAAGSMALRVAAIDSSAASGLAAKDALLTAATRGGTLYTDAYTRANAIDTTALDSAMTSFLLRHPTSTASGADVNTMHTKLLAATSAANTAKTALDSLKNTVTADKNSALDTYTALQSLDAKTSPTTSDVTAAKADTALIQSKSSEVLDLVGAMDAQKGVVFNAVSQVESLQTQFQTYVNTLTAQAKSAMTVDATNDSLAFREDVGAQTINLLANDVQGSGGGSATVSVKILSQPASGKLYLSDGTTEVTPSTTLTAAQAQTLKYVPGANRPSPGAAGTTFNDTFTYQLVRSGTVEALNSTNTAIIDQSYSTSDTASVTLTVTHVNYAPTLQNAAGGVTLPSIAENATNPAGVLVKTLLAGRAADAETASGNLGLALTSASTASGGTWEYKLDGGSWSAITASNLTTANALLLGPNDSLRFVPGTNWNSQSGGHTAPTFSFRAWDGSTGQHGTYADTSVNSAFSAFSQDTATTTATLTASQTVTAVAVAPTLTVADGYSEAGGAPVALNISNAILPTVNPDSYSIQITGVPANATLNHGNVSGGVWTLSMADLSGLTLTPASTFNGDLTLTVKSIATDGSGANVVTDTKSYTFNVGVGAQNVLVDGVVDRSGSTRAVNMIGGNNADTMTATARADTLSGGGGNDILTGGGGADTLTGGSGADVFRYTAAAQSSASATDVITDFTSGSDAIRLQGSAGLTLLRGAYPYAGSVASTISAITGNSLVTNSVVYFTDNTDGYLYVKGTGTGTSFDGTLIRLAGVKVPPSLADIADATSMLVAGTASADTLIGGSGKDIMVGGAGNDVFVFNAATDSTTANPDTIRDFTSSSDQLMLGGAAGYRQLHGAYTWAGSTTATIAAINADSSVSNSLVFFSDGSQGWVYAKGAGNGATSFNGLLVNLTGQTTPPAQLASAIPEYLLTAATNIGTNEDTVGSGTASVRFGGSETYTYDFGRDGSNNPITSLVTSKGLVSINTATGAYSYRPGPAVQTLAANQTTTDSFVVHSHSSGGLESTATVTVNLTGVNDAPKVAPPALTFVDGGIGLPTTAATRFSGSDSFTIVMDVKPTGDGGLLFHQSSYYGQLGIWTSVGANGSLTFAFDKQSFGWDWGSAGTPAGVVTMNQWSQLAFVKDGSTRAIYVNGSLVFSNTIGATQLSAGESGAGQEFGTSDPGNAYNGDLGSLKIYGVGLGANDLATLSAGGSVSTGLLANWQFTAGTGTTVTDLTGQTGTIALTGAAGSVGWITGAEDTVLTGQVVAADIDGGTLTYALAGAAGHGTATVTSDGHWSYTPAANYNGVDSFVVRVSDGQGGTSNGTVYVNLTPVNDAPTSTPFSALNLSVGTPVNLNLFSHFSDADIGDTLTFNVTGVPSWLNFNSTTGVLSGTTPLNAGSASVTIEATDSTGAKTTQTLALNMPQIAIAGVNQPGSALVFDGVNDVAKVNASLTGAATVEMWVQAAHWAPGTSQTLFSNGLNSTDPGYIALEIAGTGYLTLHYGGSGQTGETSVTGWAGSFAGGTWHHVAADWSYDAIQSQTTLNLYVDGALAQSLSTDLHIDTSATSAWIVGDGLCGSIDNLRLWSDVRTPSEIAGNMPLKAPTSTDHLVGDWRMDNVSGDSVPNATGGAALVLGADTVVANDDPARLNPPGHVMSLPGGTYIELQNAVITPAMTFEAWVRPTELSVAFRPVFSIGASPYSSAFSIGINNSGQLVLKYLSGPELITEGAGSVTAGAWNHIAAVVQPENGGSTIAVTLYVDGAEVSTTHGLPLIQSGETRVNGSPVVAYVGGTAGGGETYMGDIGDVRLYGLARTPTDIAGDMNTRLGDDSYGLLVGLPLDNIISGDGYDSTWTKHYDDGNTYSGASIIGSANIVANKPASYADTLSVREDTSVTSRVLAVDADVNGGALTYSLASNGQPSHGSLKLDSDGNFTYRPDENYTGSDQFTVSVSDGVHTSTKTIAVTVTAVDDPVTANPPAAIRHGALGLYDQTAVSIAGGLATGTHAVTYEAWVRPWGNNSAPQTILSAGGGNDSVTLSLEYGHLSLDVSGHIVSSEYSPGVGEVPLGEGSPGEIPIGVPIYGSYSLSDGRWHHVAAVLENGSNGTATMTLYVDGRTVAEGSFAGSYDLNGTTAWLGRGLTEGDAQYLGGEISDVRVYTEARAATDILSDMSGGAANGTNLYARWEATESSGSLLNDSTTASAHDGTLTGTSFEWDNRVVAVTRTGEPTSIGGLTLYDPEQSPPAVIRVVLSAGHGILHLDPTKLSGVTFAEGTANDSGTIVLTGSLTALNTALSVATYTPTGGYAGYDGVKVVIDEMSTVTTRMDGGTLDILVLPKPTPYSDTLTGSTGNDVIDGLAGDDAIWGRSGNDTLLGGAGMDMLEGDSGDDLLVGGIEGDVLRGGDGADTIRYLSRADSSTPEWDVISDFTPGTDKLDIVGLRGLSGLALVDLGMLSGLTPSQQAQLFAADNTIADNTILTWQQDASTWIYVKASASQQGGLFIELQNTSGGLTNADILQLAATSVTTGSSLALSSTTYTVSGVTLFGPGTTVAVSGTGALGGSGEAMIAGALNWTGGTLQADQGVLVSGTASITGTASRTLNTILAVAGETTLANATITGTGEFANGGFLTTTASANVGTSIANGGVIRVVTSSANTAVTLTAGAGLSSDGVVELDARYGTSDNAALTMGTGSAYFIGAGGYLRARNDGSATHTITGEVDLVGGGIRAEGNLTINNQGTVFFAESGYIDVAQDRTLTINGGTGGQIQLHTSSQWLNGNGTLNLAGVQTVWVGPAFDNNGPLHLKLDGAVTFIGSEFVNANGSSLTLDTSNDAFTNGLRNQGILMIQGTTTSANGALTVNHDLTNENTLQFQVSSGKTATVNLGTGTLNNSGTVQILSDGSSDSAVVLNGQLTNSGALDVEGKLRVVSTGFAVNSYNIIDLAATGTLDVSATNGLNNQSPATLRGSGHIVGDVTSAGLIEADGTTLNISGNLTAMQSSRIAVEVTASGSGAMTVGQTATVAGQLEFSFTDYVPTEGQTYTILTANSLDTTQFTGWDTVAHNGDDIGHNLGSAWTADWTNTGSALQVTFHKVATATLGGSWTSGLSTVETAVELSATPVTVGEAVTAGTLRSGTSGSLTIGTGGTLDLESVGLMQAGTTLTIAGGTLQGNANILVDGAFNFESGTLGAGTGTLKTSGTATLASAGGTLTIDRRLQLGGNSTLSGLSPVTLQTTTAYTSLENTGTMSVAVVAATLGLQVTNREGGTMTWNAATASGQGTDMSLTVDSALHNFLNDGTLLISGGSGGHGVVFDGANGMLQNNGTMTLASSSIQLDVFDAQVANYGTINIGHDLQVTGQFDSWGTTNLQSHQLTLTNSNQFVNNGILTGSGIVDDAGAASFVNHGVITPGGSAAGSLTFSDDLTLGSDSHVILNVGSGGSDLLHVGGALACGGVLEIAVNGSLSNGTTYTPLTYGSATGSFSSIVNLDTAAGNMLLDPLMSGGALTLTARTVTQTATAFDDLVTGSNGNDFLCLGQGNDTVHAAGGADAIFGQGGDDTIGISGTAFHILDGGTGFDTLSWEGASGTTLNLTTVTGIIQNIEAVSLEAAGTQTLTLNADTIAKMMGGATNSVTGTANTLVVIGQNDVLNLSGANWQHAPDNVHLAEDPGTSYSVYTNTSSNGSSVAVYVDNSNTVHPNT